MNNVGLYESVIIIITIIHIMINYYCNFGKST